ncbi:glutamate--cysteine ligase [Psychromonas sp. 14N.309.X.WAT.B.A12]|uniref:glutamate--cysteine ligase n=1 Tax=unclassified Psychromonas TaxID=2614957 RepID=UPI0025B0C2C6|nr:glutamate--cysteine ligase [Psychromonas sp. 14N.309.X.WAT.B.A12]MDN2664323.1 glutamate--cysteine ligase [Psychromonas sp. 14N.309.X.WAT.B.A12]
MANNFQQRITILSKYSTSLTEFGRGIERETLRVNADGKLSQEKHPSAYGCALTHDSITTDFAESLLEFITPVAKGVDQLFDYLNDIHHHVAVNLPSEQYLWPMSMPCYVQTEDHVELAQFGTSNIGRMKTTYRQGLKNRYGSMMQIISGVHYNFSLPADFWDVWAKLHNSPLTGQAAQSAGYMGLIRNYLRYGWVIPYLFGASPAICKSFLQGKETKLSFETTGKGTIYLPYGTSLRLSDLGYTNSSQSGLNICYNSLDDYLSSVRKALSMKDPSFTEMGIVKEGEYLQLNDNVLQIENELYASIRAKRVQTANETPSQALKARGIEYIEIRSLDVNPFCKLGITKEQVHFLDLFLTWCASIDSPELSQQEYKACASNFNEVVTRGRDPQLTLEIAQQTLDIAGWGEWLNSQLMEMAVLLDKNNSDDCYQNAMRHISPRFSHPENTSSARILERIKQTQGDNGSLALQLSKQYKAELTEQSYTIWSDQEFAEQKQQSIVKQKQIEDADTLSFPDFLANYFANANKQ